MPLTEAEHTELNFSHPSRSRLNELKAKYADDPAALLELDCYDPNSTEKRKWKEYREELTREGGGREGVLQRLERWFRGG